MYDNVLGFGGDPSKIDIGAFAETRGNTIILNKFMFDDSQFLEREYDEAVDDGHFAKGTTYRSIIAHEVGHIIEKRLPRLYRSALHLFEKEALKKGVDVRNYMHKLKYPQ